MVLFVGRIDPIKGIDTLIDAAEIMLSTSIDRARADIPHRGWRSGRGRHPGRPTGGRCRTRSHSAASRPVFVSSARNRKTSYPSSMPRPTSWPCRRATSPSGWSRSRRWPVASRSSPRGSAACASRSTKGTTGFLVKPQSPQALAGALEQILSDDTAARGDVGRGATFGRALRLVKRRQAGQARLPVASPKVTAPSSAPAATSSR